MIQFTLIAISATLFCCFLALFTKVKGIRKSNESWKQPPGASLFALFMLWKGDIFQYYQDLKTKYGPVFRASVFGSSIIIINDMKLARTCFTNVNCCGTLAIPFYKIIGNLRGQVSGSAGEGIFFADAGAAGEQRKFFLKQFAELGRRSGSWQTQQEAVILSLLKELESKDGKPFVASKFFAPFASTALWATLGNEPLTPNDFQMHHESMKNITEFNRLQDIFCVWMPEISVKLSSRSQKRFDIFKQAIFHAKTEVDKQLSKRIPNEPRSIIDAYQDRVEATVEESSSFHPCRRNIYGAMLDLLYAAMDTTSSAMDWLLLHIAINPRVQKKLQKEIDVIVGRNRLPNLLDRSRMPFTEACILETLRLQPLVPLSVPREVTCDTEVDGYFFKKGSVIFTNTLAINRDPEIWKEPNSFLLERFLCPESRQVVAEKRKLINTFGTGLRSCPGQQIAQETLFVFVAAVFQKFSVFSPGELSPTPSIGLLSPPRENLLLVFQPRDE